MYYNEYEDKEVARMKKITTNNKFSIYKFNKGEGFIILHTTEEAAKKALEELD